MTEDIGLSLLILGGLFALSYLAGGLLVRIRIPGVMGALVVALALQLTPFGAEILDSDTGEILSFLGELGAMFLLFYIGLQVDIVTLRKLGRDVILLTALVTMLPFLFGLGAMLALGFPPFLAVVIGMTRIPTAEAVVAPILDEFGLTRTKVGQLIIGAGTLDDIFEILLVVLVSGWIAEQGGVTSSVATSIESAALGIAVLLGFSVVLGRWGLPWLSRLLPAEPRHLVLLSVAVLLTFGGLSEYSGAGFVLGSLAAGMAMRKTLEADGEPGAAAIRDIQSIAYGFLGPAFFLWVGLTADLSGIIRAPVLTLALYLTAMFGKVFGALALVPLRRLDSRQALVTGIGLDARLTTEIVVAQLLYSSGLIDLPLFTALVAASSISTTSIPLIFSVLVRRWRSSLDESVPGSASK